jgi:opacity protein-like surface antigen
MRKWIVFCMATLCLAGTAIAQNTPTVPASATPAPPAASNRYSDDTKWLIGMGYVYQRFDVGGASVNLNGVQGSVSRFFNNYMAIEGNVSATFGNLTPTVREQLAFYGGGVRIQSRGRKLEPWVHGIFGGVHSRVSQGVGPATNNGFGIMAGGGVDYKFSSHMALRVQGDYLGSHFSGLWQTSASVGVGIAFGF